MLCHVFWSQVEYKIVCFICIPDNDCHTPLSFHSTRYISNLYYSTRFEKSKLIVVPVWWLLNLVQKVCLVMVWKFLTLVLVLIVSPGLPLLDD